MISFLDTSALLKLYHIETDSAALDLHLLPSTALVISVLSKSELISAGWKKVRSTQQKEAGFTEGYLHAMLSAFEADANKFLVLSVEPADWLVCEELLQRCNAAARKLQTADALQLVSALKLGNSVDEFITFDKGLREAAKFVGLHAPDIVPPPTYGEALAAFS